MRFCHSGAFKCVHIGRELALFIVSDGGTTDGVVTVCGQATPIWGGDLGQGHMWPSLWCLASTDGELAGRCHNEVRTYERNPEFLEEKTWAPTKHSRNFGREWMREYN